MTELDISFHVGDQVIHCTHGPGVIIQLDEKELLGNTQKYYVLQMQDLTLWVPIRPISECSLRYPTPASDFPDLFRILTSPAEPLSTDRFERKMQLVERLKGGKLDTVCQVVRDLTHYKRTHSMNDHDTVTLERARVFLLREWSIALSVPIQQADQSLRDLLDKV